MSPGAQLLLPGLFELPLEELDAQLLRDDLPGLNYLLGRASRRVNEDFGIDVLVSRALFGDPRNGAGLPLAAAFAPDPQSARRCLLLEAVHLQADLHGAIAVPITRSGENFQDINLIINDLSDVFKVDCDITALAHGRFLLQLREFDPPTHYPHPFSVLGKSVSPFFEQSRRVLPWYRLVNEFQMFMHQHPVNERRAQQGRLQINSLWAWGAGELPKPVNRPAWFCDDDLLNHFAGSLGLQVAGLDAVRGELAGDALVVDLRLLELLKSGSDARLDELLLDIERNLLTPLLRRGRGPVTLSAGHGHDFVLGRRAGLRFWRGPSSLLDWR